MKLAFVFPGQGSQSLGMLSDLVEAHPEVLEYYKQASQVLGYDLWDVVQNDAEKLNQTQVTQPALLTASYALYQILKKQYPEVKPDVMAGHSLGEYSALTCAGVLDFQTAVKLVEARGKAMQGAVPAGTGAMYAILGLEDQVVIDTCAKVASELNQVVSAVNFNSPVQIVIAGTAQAAQQAATLLKEAGAKRALPLSVSVPSHCVLMQPAREVMEGLLAQSDFHQAHTPVVHNTDLSTSSTKEEYIVALGKQLTGPVL